MVVSKKLFCLMSLVCSSFVHAMVQQNPGEQNPLIQGNMAATPVPVQPPAALPQQPMQPPVAQPGFVPQQPAALPNENLTLNDSPDEYSQQISPEHMYQEAQHLYDQLFNQQLDLNKIIQQHTVQERTLSDEIDACAKNIGQKGGKIKGISLQLKQYITQKSADITDKIRENPQDHAILEPITTKIQTLSQSLTNLTSGITEIDAEYTKIKGIHKQIRDTNQVLEQKELAYSSQLRMISEYKATLLEEKNIDAHTTQMQNIRIATAEADKIFQEIKSTSFDKNIEVRTIVQSIDAKLQQQEQQLTKISTEIDTIMKMISDYETTNEKKLLESINKTTEQPTPKVPQDSQKTSLLGTLKKIFKNNKGLFSWVRGYAHDVKEKMLHTKEPMPTQEVPSQQITKVPATPPSQAPAKKPAQQPLIKPQSPPTPLPPAAPALPLQAAPVQSTPPAQPPVEQQPNAPQVPVTVIDNPLIPATPTS